MFRFPHEIGMVRRNFIEKTGNFGIGRVLIQDIHIIPK